MPWEEGVLDGLLVLVPALLLTQVDGAITHRNRSVLQRALHLLVDGSRDPVDVWTAPADGTYTLLVRDIAGGSRGGPDSYYRLEVGPVVPTTTIVAGAPTLTVKPGAKGEWSLTVYQWYSPEDLVVHVEGLPKSVTAEPVKIPASKRPDTRTVKLVLTAAADAPPGFGVVHITARPAEGAGVPVEAAWMLTGDGGVPLGTGAARSLVVLVPGP